MITEKILKNGGKFLKNQVHTICVLVYEQCHAQTQWTSNLMISLPKKGSVDSSWKRAEKRLARLMSNWSLVAGSNSLSVLHLHVPFGGCLMAQNKL